MSDLHGKGQSAASENAGDQGGRDHGQVLPGVLQAGLVNLRLGDPLRLGPPVLEPDLHLGLRQLQLGGELGPLGYRQVLLLPELLLQGVQLLGGEGGAGLPVGLVLPQGTAQGAGRGLEPQVWKQIRFSFRVSRYKPLHLEIGGFIVFPN